jgi:hypothetical protein
MLISIGLLLIVFLGCARTYQSITADTFTPGQRVSISGIPQKPETLNFVPPTPAHEGYWHVKVNGVNFIGYVNFENAPRVRAIRNLAENARQKNQKVKVAGKAREGFVKLESFNGIRIDTPWYKNSNPHYSYRHYYKWYPFAYEPNKRAMHN